MLALFSALHPVPSAAEHRPAALAPPPSAAEPRVPAAPALYADELAPMAMVSLAARFQRPDTSAEEAPAFTRDRAPTPGRRSTSWGSARLGVACGEGVAAGDCHTIPDYSIGRQNGCPPSNPTCRGAGFRGACGPWQIIGSTWNGYGGYATACDAPLEVQEAKAEELWADGAGCSHWDASGGCGEANGTPAPETPPESTTTTSAPPPEPSEAPPPEPSPEEHPVAA